MLSRLLRLFPGLGTSLSSLLILIGILAMVPYALAVFRARSRATQKALCVTAVILWCVLCALAYPLTAASVYFVGSWSTSQLHYVQVAVPCYAILGVLVLSLVYVLARLYASWRGVPVDEEDQRRQD